MQHARVNMEFDGCPQILQLAYAKQAEAAQNAHDARGPQDASTSRRFVREAAEPLKAHNKNVKRQPRFRIMKCDSTETHL
mmetsp:Transcript_75774/g.134220  ORF Transcript_75774/g.134220 Transcript_75774/m.134220 type:complete len:80 (+) Transcript_75774:76-315(+)